MVKSTLSGTRRKKIRVSGFRARLKTKNGRAILNKRRRKERQKLSVSH